MQKPIEVPFSQIKNVIVKCFPGAKSRRTVKIHSAESYNVHDYWDGGSRDECRFLDVVEWRSLSSADIPREQRQQAGNPYNLPVADVKLSPRFVVVEHCIFRGKDLGYRVYVHPTLMDSFLGNVKQLELGKA